MAAANSIRVLVVSKALLPGGSIDEGLDPAESEVLEAALAASEPVLAVAPGVLRSRGPRTGVVAAVSRPRGDGLWWSITGLHRARIRRLVPPGRALVEELAEPPVAQRERRQLARLRRLLLDGRGGRAAKSLDDIAGMACTRALLDRLCAEFASENATAMAVLRGPTIATRLDALLKDGAIQRDSGAREDPEEDERKLPAHVRAVLARERSHHYSRDEEAIRYLSQMTWIPETARPLDLERARRYLDRSHAGMKAVKEAVLDHLVLVEWGRRHPRVRATSQPLCLVGPPGTGKTSFAGAIAEVQGRRLVRIGMAGLEEVGLNGADRSYSQARPGIFPRVLASCGRHPTGLVFLLDEIDKVSDHPHHSPVSGLLALLDPEQNSTWRDHFFDEFYFDLSGAQFICTANQLERIAPPLRDRLSVIELPAYGDAERVRIGCQHVLPRLQRELGTRGTVTIPRATVEALVARSPGAGGMRLLKQQLQTLLSRGLRQHLTTGKRVVVDPELALRLIPTPPREGDPETAPRAAQPHIRWVLGDAIRC